MNKRTKSLYGYIFPAVGGLFMTSFVLTVLVSVILMIVGMVFSEHIIDISGGYKLSSEMREMAVDYLFYYSAFSIPMLMSTCLSVFVSWQ